MTYYEEFASRLTARDYNKILILWQEYCESDELDVEDLKAILCAIKQSDFAKSFGQYVEAILPLVMTLKDESSRFDALCSIYDLQTSNSQALYDLALEVVKTQFSSDPQLPEKMRLVGLRTKDSFQGALSNLRLLNHIKRGNFVLHTAGWGVGEIVDFSFIREQVGIEFENLHGGKKEISFKSGFRTLIPLKEDHFLVERFIGSEQLQKYAETDGVGLIIKIIKELGPQTASEIKDLLSDAVIPQALYSKWWQSTRSKLKKNDLIIAPNSTKEPFALRKEKISHDERYGELLEGKTTFEETLHALYTLVRDFPEALKTENTLELIIKKAKGLLNDNPSVVQKILIHFFLEQLDAPLFDTMELGVFIRSIDNFKETLQQISIVAFRKFFLHAIFQFHPQWPNIFVSLLDIAEPIQLKEYIFKELLLKDQSIAVHAVEKIRDDPIQMMDAFLWYFQKITSGQAPIVSDQNQIERFFESFFVLMATIEPKRQHKELLKKMHAMIYADRFRIVRDMLKNSDVSFAREFLLLASKCQSFTMQEQKTFRSLVGVVHPAYFEGKEDSMEQTVIWTTEEGYRKAKDRIEHIGTVEIVDNAKEIEAARSHGDLRENAEYKCALERRNRLQNELKVLSDQFNRARILSSEDISTKVVSVGTKIEVKDLQGMVETYTILGPWDVDPSANILSVESKLAQILLGKKIGNSCDIKGKTVHITKIASYLP